MASVHRLGEVEHCGLDEEVYYLQVEEIWHACSVTHRLAGNNQFVTLVGEGDFPLIDSKIMWMGLIRHERTRLPSSSLTQYLTTSLPPVAPRSEYLSRQTRQS